MKFKAFFYQNPIGFLASVVLLVMSITSAFFDRYVSLSLLIAFLIIFFISVSYSVLALKTTRKYVSAVNKSLLAGKSDGVDQFPLPAIMCDRYGNIVWYNNSFNDEIVEAYDFAKLTAKDFFEDFSYDKYSEERIVNASFEDREYTAFITKVKSESNPMLCIYFFDDTALKEISLEYEFSRPFVMLMLVDNIEQLSRQLTDSKFALVLSGIESLIEDWLKDESVILKKIGNGSFLVIGEKRNLDELSEKKFSILNNVRNYTYKDIPVNATLSVGVGYGENFSECESRAKKSLDMALSRGGDQAAIFTENGYIYYGGVSNRTNDNSRVSPRQTAASISNLAKKYKKAIIVGHRYSDNDAIGAAAGMQFFTKSCGLESYIVVDSKTTLATSLVAFLQDKGVKNIISPSKAVDICLDDTLVIVVDSQRKQLLDSSDLYDLAGATVVIDHHRRTDDYIDDADISYNSPSASSTCELVAELIQYSTIQDNLSDTVATALLSGIVLDTKDFVLRTSQRTFEAAGFLRDTGADTVEVRKFFSIDAEMTAIKNEIVSSCKDHNGFMISTTTSDSKNIRVITSVAADEMLKIDGSKASFVISKLHLNKYQISARSLGEENVQLIMENLDGGGHSTMAAAQIKASDMNEAKEILLDAIKKYIEHK